MGSGGYTFISSFYFYFKGRDWFQDLDGGVIGQTVSQTFIGSSGPATQMTWTTVPSNLNLTTREQFEHALVYEKVWGIVAST